MGRRRDPRRCPVWLGSPLRHGPDHLRRRWRRRHHPGSARGGHARRRSTSASGSRPAVRRRTPSPVGSLAAAGVASLLFPAMRSSDVRLTNSAVCDGRHNRRTRGRRRHYLLRGFDIAVRLQDQRRWEKGSICWRRLAHSRAQRVPSPDHRDRRHRVCRRSTPRRVRSPLCGRPPTARARRAARFRPSGRPSGARR